MERSITTSGWFACEYCTEVLHPKEQYEALGPTYTKTLCEKCYNNGDNGWSQLRELQYKIKELGRLK